MPDWAAVEQKCRSHSMPKHMSGYLFLESPPSGESMEDGLHGVVGQAARLVPSCDEQRRFVVPPALKVASKPLYRPLREEEHPLLPPFSNDFYLPTLCIHITAVEREDL